MIVPESSHDRFYPEKSFCEAPSCVLISESVLRQGKHVLGRKQKKTIKIFQPVRATSSSHVFSYWFIVIYICIYIYIRWCCACYYVEIVWRTFVPKLYRLRWSQLGTRDSDDFCARIPNEFAQNLRNFRFEHGGHIWFKLRRMCGTYPDLNKIHGLFFVSFRSWTIVTARYALSKNNALFKW